MNHQNFCCVDWYLKGLWTWGERWHRSSRKYCFQHSSAFITALLWNYDYRTPWLEQGMPIGCVKIVKNFYQYDLSHEAVEASKPSCAKPTNGSMKFRSMVELIDRHKWMRKRARRAMQRNMTLYWDKRARRASRWNSDLVSKEKLGIHLPSETIAFIYIRVSTYPFLWENCLALGYSFFLFINGKFPRASVKPPWLRSRIHPIFI